METLQRLHNRGSISTGYDIDNSLKLEHGNNEWLYRASPTSGNRRTHTFSFWIKRSTLGNPTASGSMYVIGQGQHGRMLFSSDHFQYRFDDGHDARDVTTKHRDPSAWLHVVVAVDTNQSTSSNRVKIYFNGVQTTTIDLDGGSYPDIQDQGPFLHDGYMTIGTAPFGGSYSAGDGDYDMSGYLAEFAVVDGTAYDPTAFGETDSDTGIWKPKDLSDITWGSEGFYLKFDDSSNMGKDSSGNSNNFTTNNVSSADQATDTCTNNFATINPLFKYPSSQVIKEGNTQVTRGSGSGLNKTFISTVGVSSGKWYAEFKPVASSNYVVGIMPDSTASSVALDGNYLGNSAFASSIGYYSDTGQKIVAPSGGSSYGDSYTTNDIIGIALDMDNSKVYFSKNGTYQNSGVPTSGSTGTGAIDLTVNETTFIGFSYDGSGDMQCNFGGYHVNTLSSSASDDNGYGSFEYAPPSGYYALCTKNLQEFG